MITFLSFKLVEWMYNLNYSTACIDTMACLTFFELFSELTLIVIFVITYISEHKR